MIGEIPDLLSDEFANDPCPVRRGIVSRGPATLDRRFTPAS
jgi:hypothetical protein